VTTLRDIVDIIPKAVPYQQGYLSFGALTSLLPGHHVSSDMFFRQILGLDFVGFGQPATLLGPMYGDFGILGIVLQMTILGFAFTRLYYRMLRKGETITALLYAWTSHAILFSLFGSLFTYFILAAVPVGWLLFGKLLRSPDRASGNKLSEAFPSCATP